MRTRPERRCWSVSDRAAQAGPTQPPAEVRPAAEDQLGEVLAAAQAADSAICIAGGGTKSTWGNPASRCDLVLSTRALRGFSHADADNLTLSAAAGTTIAEAKAQARAMDRVLPLDPRHPAQATVGGVAATADEGPRAAGYGGVRDVVLGLRAVLVDGSVVKFGGLTMKNVAGYDMTKLFVGSFGVLGVITEVTFRLLPRPETQALVVLPLPSLAEAKAGVACILDSYLQPLALEVVSPGSGDHPLLLAGFAGHPAAVERSVREVRDAHPVPAEAVLVDEDAEGLYEALAAAGPGGGPPRTVGARASVPLSRVLDYIEAAETGARANGLSLSYRGSAARGVIDLFVSGRSAGDSRHGPEAEAAREAARIVDKVSAFTAGLRAGAVAMGGSLVITERSALLPQDFDAWGEPTPAVAVMRRIKERFDPRGVLNPGRFVGGI